MRRGAMSTWTGTQSELTPIIGTDRAASVDVRVTFPDGSVVTRLDVPSGWDNDIRDVK